MARVCQRGAVNLKAVAILAFSILLLAGGVVGAYYLQVQRQSEEALAAGHTALERREWADACRHLRRYLARNPDDVEILERYAEANLAVRPASPDNLASAVNAYRRLLRHRSGDVELARQLVKLCVRQGELAQAVLIYDQLSDRTDPECTIWWARAMAKLRRGAEAAEQLRKLVAGRPDQVEAWLTLCQIERHADNEPTRLVALDCVDQALTANPESAALHVRRAALLRDVTDDPAAARRALERADALGPTDPAILRELAQEWFNLGELDRALAYLPLLDDVDEDVLREHDVDPDAFNLARFTLSARLALARQDDEGGVGIADRALAELPASGRTAFLPMALELYVSGGRAEDARKCFDEYRKATIVAGASAAALEPLDTLEALVLLAEGKPYPAIERLDHLVARNPQNLEAWKLLAAACEKTGQESRARRSLEEYLLRRPRDSAVAFSVARMYAGLDWSRALQYVKQAEEEGFSDSATALLRIEARLELMGDALDPDRAEALANELAPVLQTTPGSARAQALNARLLARRGNPDEAIASLAAVSESVDEPWLVSAELAAIHKNQGRIAKAIEVCRAAGERLPHQAAPRITLAQLQYIDGRHDESRQTLEEAAVQLQGTERVRAESALVQHLMDQKLHAEAAQVLQRAADERPDDPSPRLALLALSEIQSDPKRCQRLIDEVKAVEGERGLRWQVEQAWMWLRIGAWKDHAESMAETLTRCIETEPGWSSPIKALGTLYELQGELERAEGIYRNALSSLPSDPDIIGRLVVLLERQRRFSAAQEVLDGAPADMRALTGYRLDVAIAREDYESAIRELERQAAANPRDIAARVALACLTYRARQDAQAALQHLDSASAIEPDHPSILGARVAVLHASGRGGEALDLLNQAVDQRNDFDSYLLRAGYFSQSGQTETAERDYRHLTTFRGAEAEGFAALGRFYQEMGQNDDAVKAWRSGLALSPEHTDLRRRLAIALLGRPGAEERGEGRKLLGKMLEERPDDPELLSAQAAIWLDEQTEEATQKANDLLERVVRIAPERIGAHLTLVRLASEERNERRAAELAARALGQNPKNIPLRLASARLEAASGNVSDARDMATAVLEADPKNVPARNLLAAIALRTGDVERAETLNRDALAIEPQNPMARMAQAAVLARKGQTAAAVEIVQAFLREPPEPVSSSMLALLTSTPAGRSGWTADSASDAAMFRESMLLETDVGDSHPDSLGREFQRLAAQEHDPVEVHVTAAQTAYALGQYELARHAYERVLSLDPDHQRALNDLAWIVGHDLKQPQLGFELAKKGIQRYPDDAHLLDTRGVLLIALNRPDEARRDLERCLELSVGLPRTRASALMNLARLYVQQGATAQARTRMLDALELDRESGVLSDRDRAEIEQFVSVP